MHKTIFVFILSLLVSAVLLSQRPRGGQGGQRGERPEITVKGLVVDQATGNPLEFATISLISKRDSSLVGGGLTELDGTFEVKAKIGPLRAEIEYISYEKLIIEDVPFDRDAIRAGNRVIDMGQITMSSSAELLEEVEITAEKSETQFSLDKRVFNVGKDLANQGGTAEDILDNVPSVTVDIEGQVSLRGSDGVRILIDGRPSGLAGGDNANGLRSIPANMIEKVEVITNPSARYEAEGMAGILNIVLKKQKGGGFNGSFDFNGGFPASAGVGANVNYRKDKVNWFANYGLRYRESPGSGYYNQSQERGNDLFIQRQVSDRNRTGLSNSIRFGIDYFPREKETITGSFLYRSSDEDNLSSLTYNDYLNDLSNLITTTLRTDDQREEESNLEYSINYNKEYSSRRHTLNATLQYRDKQEAEYSDFFEEVTFSSGSDIPDVIQRSGNEEGEMNLLFQVDFTRPLEGEDHQYELGVRTNLRDIDNDYSVTQLEDGVFVNLEGLSNNFEYDEDVYALYGIYGRKFGKIGMQAGLRAENSHVVTSLLQTNEINDRNYFGLFPSMHVNLEVSESNAVQISYSRRIRRPRFWDLNPFFTFSDSRNTFSGNPNLDPEYTDSYEIGNIKYFESGTISGSFFYRRTTDVIQRILEFRPDGTTNRQPENLAERDDYGLELTFQYSGLKWWRVDGNANFFRSITNGQNLDDGLQADTYTWFARMTNRFTFWDGADLQLRLNYRAPRETTQGKSKSITSIDLGLSKDLSKDVTMTIGVRDLLNSRKRRGETIGDGFFRESEFQWRARSANIAINYRINQKKKRSRGGNRGGDFEGGEEF
jgi:outer membrane receptor protein involved in Fe transport